MSEIINTYLLSNPFELVPMDRDDFYREQIESFKNIGEPSRANEIINIFLFNSHGELLLQKRSYDKKHNPGLIDKSIGGHVVYGDTPDYSVMLETVQELQTPSVVLRTEEDFNKTYQILDKYLETVSLIKLSATKLIIPIKIINGEKIKIANKMNIYFGVYDGRIRPVDREAKGVLFYSLEELEQEMKQFPDLFTDDLHILLKDFNTEINEFVNKIKKD